MMGYYGDVQGIDRCFRRQNRPRHDLFGDHTDLRIKRK